MKKIIISLITLILLLSMLFNTVYAVDENTDYSNLPTSFDLRNVIDINVENQGERYWCNAYAYTKTIQTYLQMTKGINYNLSESYIAYSNASYFGGTYTDLIDSKSINESAVYLSNQSSMLVLESDIPNVDYLFTETNKEKFNNVRKVVKSVENKANLYAENKDDIKNYIIKNGGVRVSITAEKKYYNSYTSSIYSPTYEFGNDINKILEEQGNDYLTGKILDELALKYHLHEVTIIGWDDNYSKDNFNSNNKPNKDGAWLILNSWGADWGNNGTAWLSYEDEYLLNGGTFGIESVLLEGEINANFSYQITSIKSSSYVAPEVEITATITVDDKIEEIEGWTKNGEHLYIKKFNEPFLPYTIELCSQIDNAKTTVTVAIPDEEFTQGFKEPNKFLLFLQGATFVILPIFGFIIIIVFIKKILFRPFKKKK